MTATALAGVASVFSSFSVGTSSYGKYVAIMQLTSLWVAVFVGIYLAGGMSGAKVLPWYKKITALPTPTLWLCIFLLLVALLAASVHGLRVLAWILPGMAVLWRRFQNRIFREPPENTSGEKHTPPVSQEETAFTSAWILLFFFSVQWGIHGLPWQVVLVMGCIGGLVLGLSFLGGGRAWLLRGAVALAAGYAGFGVANVLGDIRDSAPRTWMYSLGALEIPPLMFVIFGVCCVLGVLRYGNMPEPAPRIAPPLKQRSSI